MVTPLKGAIDAAVKVLQAQIMDEHFRSWAQLWLLSQEGISSWGMYCDACERQLPYAGRLIAHAADYYYEGTHAWIGQMEEMCAVAQCELNKAIVLGAK